MRSAIEFFGYESVRKGLMTVIPRSLRTGYLALRIHFIVEADATVKRSNQLERYRLSLCLLIRHRYPTTNGGDYCGADQQRAQAELEPGATANRPRDNIMG